mmetsp:Transcript_123798/g.276565  ORF Transcript_123798/g.276565 Transcript_123798/m.276565 type:complete len:240 (+) Transcript_123798:240-959(+)
MRSYSAKRRGHSCLTKAALATMSLTWTAPLLKRSSRCQIRRMLASLAGAVTTLLRLTGGVQERAAAVAGVGAASGSLPCLPSLLLPTSGEAEGGEAEGAALCETAVPEFQRGFRVAAPLAVSPPRRAGHEARTPPASPSELRRGGRKPAGLTSGVLLAASARNGVPGASSGTSVRPRERGDSGPSLLGSPIKTPTPSGGAPLVSVTLEMPPAEADRGLAPESPPPWRILSRAECQADVL